MRSASALQLCYKGVTQIDLQEKMVLQVKDPAELKAKVKHPETFRYWFDKIKRQLEETKEDKLLRYCCQPFVDHDLIIDPKENETFDEYIIRVNENIEILLDHYKIKITANNESSAKCMDDMKEEPNAVFIDCSYL